MYLIQELVNGSSESPLGIACQLNNQAIVELFLEAECKRDPKAIDLLKGPVREIINKRLIIEEKEMKKAAKVVFLILH